MKIAVRVIKVLLVLLVCPTLAAILGFVVAGIVSVILGGEALPDSYGAGFFFMVFGVAGLLLGLLVSVPLAIRAWEGPSHTTDG